MKTIENNIVIFSKLLLITSGVLLVVSIFMPIWRIELDAPQYPEGLALLIYSNKLAGDVNIINGLNHYIGMKTLHEEEFIEFTVLPYIIGFYAIACLAVVFIHKKKAIYFLFSAFVLFGIIAMFDFWRWENDYGHNLDPNAAIIVPGMAYQPPLIGFKQLLNFGAYSIPDIGGWLFISSGLLMAISCIIESKLFKKVKRSKIVVASVLPLILIAITACEPSKPELIKLNSDNCDNCGMTISNPKFAAEIFTKKGRAYKFDDISCMINYKNDNKEKTEGSNFYISDFLGSNLLMPAEKAIYIKGEKIQSPMGGNIAAFNNTENANIYEVQFSAEVINWSAINQ